HPRSRPFQRRPFEGDLEAVAGPPHARGDTYDGRRSDGQMILTGPMIETEVVSRRITIDPFCPEAVNPNSYNYRLGEMLKEYDQERRAFREVTLPEEGFELRPGCMYLGHTAEVIGSSAYAMSLIGRSSMGRLGLFLQVSADLGHTASCHR